MSLPEKEALLVGLHAGLAGELHESRMLPPEPSAGPLAGYQPAAGLPVEGHRGTIQIAEMLGEIKHHPTVSVPANDGLKRKKTIAFPLLGDLLWYFHDEQGPYCVNWTVKLTPEDFDRPFNAARLSPQQRIEAEAAHIARGRVEDELYRQVNVPTIHVASSDIPKHVALNLRQLYVWQSRYANLEVELQEEVVETLIARIPKGVPMFETLRFFLNRFGGTFYDYQVVLYQAIWTRKLRVDLWTPVNIDQPVHPQEKDFMKFFAQWFKRGIH
jgi:hypothetical protein